MLVYCEQSMVVVMHVSAFINYSANNMYDVDVYLFFIAIVEHKLVSTTLGFHVITYNNMEIKIHVQNVFLSFDFNFDELSSQRILESNHPPSRKPR